MGSFLLLMSDTLARTIISPPELLPVGAITSFLGGAPLFLYFLIKGGDIDK